MGILEPKPVVPEVPEATEVPETALASTDGSSTGGLVDLSSQQPIGENINPISAEITGQQEETTNVTVHTVTKIAVPEKAQRQGPQS